VTIQDRFGLRVYDHCFFPLLDSLVRASSSTFFPGEEVVKSLLKSRSILVGRALSLGSGRGGRALREPD